MSPSNTASPALLVIGDSLSFFGPKGGLPADHPQIWPNLVAAKLGLRSHLCARVGWTSRDGWWALTQDPLVWATIPHVRAVVIALGGMDSLPSPLPTALREQIRYIRPTRLRTAVRSVYRKLQPALSPLGWPMALPPSVTVSYLEKMREALSAVRPDIPIVAVLPALQYSESYARVQPGQPRTAHAIAAWAAKNNVPVVDIPGATFEHLRAGEGNPDGIHWNFDAHQRVATLMEAAIVSCERAIPDTSERSS
ncbi:SGNH/GDSL hydrolase family protein [Hoyosella rhizosphaerae]|uniref:SGNH hydrolase-type esterase domain-containing protein n=1 Tax=Hoyosella rhizosphaerae TaxID=1755582 RepID=A0A916XI52_9ACTN|nr:diglucosylglycerate octanoyltransferase [Hoyosella rhizosphaerae]MBN4928072.1 SGNH/GDSL hydrolase family protein [Hoyosella rhizosphaerae]GGC72182.1 hypothetical protein GCM10011410_26510 [Hoyosella rhizosphaerae]